MFHLLLYQIKEPDKENLADDNPFLSALVVLILTTLTCCCVEHQPLKNLYFSDNVNKKRQETELSPFSFCYLVNDAPIIMRRIKSTTIIAKAPPLPPP